jgi:hypothetical protein
MCLSVFLPHLIRSRIQEEPPHVGGSVVAARGQVAHDRRVRKRGVRRQQPRQRRQTARQPRKAVAVEIRQRQVHAAPEPRQQRQRGDRRASVRAWQEYEFKF